MKAIIGMRLIAKTVLNKTYIHRGHRFISLLINGRWKCDLCSGPSLIFKTDAFNDHEESDKHMAALRRATQPQTLCAMVPVLTKKLNFKQTEQAAGAIAAAAALQYVTITQVGDVYSPEQMACVNMAGGTLGKTDNIVARRLPLAQAMVEASMLNDLLKPGRISFAADKGTAEIEGGNKPMYAIAAEGLHLDYQPLLRARIIDDKSFQAPKFARCVLEDFESYPGLKEKIIAQSSPARPTWFAMDNEPINAAMLRELCKLLNLPPGSLKSANCLPHSLNLALKALLAKFPELAGLIARLKKLIKDGAC